MNATDKAPIHVTTVDQHRGTHEASGLPIMELTEVRTNFADYSEGRWADLSKADREWWTETLDAIHAARVELAGLRADHRGRAEEYLDQQAYGDVEDYAGLVRRAIDATRDA